MKNFAIIVYALFAAFILTAGAQKPAWQPAPGHVSLPLWPNGAPSAQPNPQPNPQPEIDTTKPTDNLIAGKPLVRLGNVSSPTLTVYAPKGSSMRPAVVVFPGWWIPDSRYRS